MLRHSEDVMLDDTVSVGSVQGLQEHGAEETRMIGGPSGLLRERSVSSPSVLLPVWSAYDAS